MTNPVEEHEMALSADARILRPPDKDAFWRVVRDCLTGFHRQTPAIASKKARALRTKLESSEMEQAGEIIYHDDPFRVACDLAEIHDSVEQNGLLKENFTAYQSILNNHHW